MARVAHVLWRLVATVVPVGSINELFSASELDAEYFDDVIGNLDEHSKQSLHQLAASYTFYQCKIKPGQT